MSDLFAQARAIDGKLNKSQEDWKEMVRLYLAAAEKGTGLDEVAKADCYSWSGEIMLANFEDKTPATYKEAMRVLEMVETVRGLPNWYGVFDIQFIGRIAPLTYGFDPSKVETGDSALIDEIAQKIVQRKGPLETANGVGLLLRRSIFEPVYAGKMKSFSENKAAVEAIDKMITMVWGALARVPIGEQGFTCHGLIYHYCKPKTRASFDKAIASYKAAINKLTFILLGASCAYTHLIDLLERPEFHGFGDIADKAASLAEAAALRTTRDAWYRTDSSRRLMLWEVQMLVDEDWLNGVFGIYKPTPEMIERAVKLGETVLLESESNLIKLQTAAVVGHTYQHRMAATKENLLKALQHYRRVYELNPSADDTLRTDFSFVNMTEAALIKANTHRVEVSAKKVLQKVLPLCFFPSISGYTELPKAELAEFKDYLSGFGASNPSHPSARSVALCFKEYKSFVERTQAMMAASQPVIQDDVFIQSKVAEVGNTLLQSSGQTGSVEKVQEKEKELLTSFEIVESFYLEEAMAQFYVGFSRTFNEIHVSSMAITSGTLATDVDSMIVSAASIVLSMVPLIGNIAPTLLERGYKEYANIKLESSAEMMVTTFPQIALLSDIVLQVLRKVQVEQLTELKELEVHSGKIMGSLMDKLEGKLTSLKTLIAKQRPKSDLEMLSAQIAMGVIENWIYSGKLPRYASPSQTAQLLAKETLRAVAEMHASHGDIVQKQEAKQQKVQSTAPASTTTTAAKPAAATKKKANSSDSAAPSSAPSTPVRSEQVSVDVVNGGCGCVIS